MDIAKITNTEELLKVLEVYKPLINNPQAIVSMKNEYKSKIEFFAKKHMIKLNKDSMKKPEKLQELLDFLLLIDQ